MPHRWFIDMVIFRENSEDIYAGIEFEAESDKALDLAGWNRCEHAVGYDYIFFFEG